MSISLLRRLLMKEAVKDTAGSSGIMSINKNIAAKVDQQVQRYVNDAMRQGVDLDTLSPEQLKMIVQMNKPKPPRVIAADSLEGRGITEALLGKRGEVVDFPQKKSFKQEIDDMIKDGTIKKGAGGIKKSKKIQDREMFQDANKRLKTDVNKIIADIKAMDPMDSMKEANSVIGRKGAYKNLTPEESKKILKDTEDHIFERDIPEEDFADGGVAGLLGERPGYQSGNTVLDKAKALGSIPYNFAKGIIGNPSNPGATTQVSLTDAQKNYLDNIAQSKGTSGTIDYSDYGSPTKTFSGISGMNPMQASLATTMGGTGYSTNPDGSFNYTGGAYDFNKGNVATDFIDKGGILGAVDRLGGGAIGKFGESIYDKVNPEEDDEYDFSGIEGQTAFLPELFMLGKSVIGPAIALGKSGLSKKAIAETLVKDRLRKEVGKRLNKKFKKIITPSRYPQGGTIKTKGPRTTTRPGGDRGRNIISGGQGDRDFSVKGPDTSANPTGKSNRASQARGYALHGADGGLASFADGGPARQNFAGGGMGRRAFLKMLAGTGAGIAGLKSGIIGTGGKSATKKAVTETVKSAGSGTPPPYFFKLVEKIKTMGDDVTSKSATTERQKVTKYKDYELTEDVTTGEQTIQRMKIDDNLKYDASEYYGKPVGEEVYMNYKPGKGQIDETTKGKTPPDEYTEDTSLIRSDKPAEGEVMDTFDGVPDDVLKEVEAGSGNVPESFYTGPNAIKKASGGIARMLGE